MSNNSRTHLLFPVVLFFYIIGCSSHEGSRPSVQTGLDILVENEFEPFRGKNVGVICNHTALDHRKKHILDLLHQAGTCSLVAIFGPEHGYRGRTVGGEAVENEIDPATGARVYSLYGKNRKPTAQMLTDVDVLIYDIQDVGARFYTYITTLSNCMASAANQGIPFYVIDRPNPIRGDRIEGPILEEDYRSFVGPHPLPIRYGLTVGELAAWINAEGLLDSPQHVDLHVIKIVGWKRSMWYDETGLPWIGPSPNMPTLETAVVYPGFCLLEGTNLSEGRGTTEPFLKIGAPWIDADRFSSALNQLNLPGIRFRSTTFTPVSIPHVALRPKYLDEGCSGVAITITDRDVYRPIEAALHILEKTKMLYPQQFQLYESRLARLYGSDRLRRVLESEATVRELIASWEEPLDQYQNTIRKYLLY